LLTGRLEETGDAWLVSMYEQVGGHPVVTTAVTVFYDRVAQDALLATWFADVDLSRLRAHQRAFLAAALDGPQLFSGRNILVVHSGLAVTHDAFSVFTQHLVATLADLGVGTAVLADVAARVEQLRASIVQ
jgi:hemoglobin